MCVAGCVKCQSQILPGLFVCPQCHSLQPRHGSRTLEPGMQIVRPEGKLVVDERLGSGGMGLVFRGWLFHDPNGPNKTAEPAPVALKQLKPLANTQAELRQLFVNEAESLKRLAHPNIVRFVDLFDWANPEDPKARPLLTLAMEYVQGDSLDKVIARAVGRAATSGTPGLAVPRAWSYFQQLLGALAAVEALHITHRDIKPANVLVRKDGIVKLADFGIARLHTDESRDVMAPGTAAYMSPEQVLAKPLDARSDLYSAAIVFYEMLAGRTPFPSEGRSEFALRRDHVERTPEPISTWLGASFGSLDAIFAKALAKERNYRFPSALALGEALRVALSFPVTPEWRSQQEFAKEAPGMRDDPSTEREARVATLRLQLVAGYRTAPLAVTVR